MMRTIAIFLSCCSLAAFSQAPVDDPGGYLPLAVGVRWVLKSPSTPTPAVFEVLERDGAGYKIRSSHPWGSSEWTLERQGEKFVMTAYGQGGTMMPLKDRPVYLDFTRGSGESWSSALGKFKLDSKSQTVKTRDEVFENCVQIRHKAGKSDLVFVFARGVGYVQFGEGSSAFVLDREASRLPGAKPGPSSSAGSAPGVPKPRGNPPARRSRAGAEGKPLFGLTPNKFASEPLTLEVMTKRFNQTVDAGVTFLVGNGEWAQLEPSPGQYDFNSVQQLTAVAGPANLPLSYTLRVVNTIMRDVPKDLQRTSWSDEKMKSRLLKLIDALAPHLKGHVRWFMLGYEIDGYFEKHAKEVEPFVELQGLATRRMKELIPDVKVSTTLTFTSLGELHGRFSALDRQMEFLSLTYLPLKPGFTVNDPSVLPADFARMKEFAAGRKIVFQEIAYPTAPSTNGSQDKQAEFYRLAFQEFARDPAAFAAVNFMNLADLSDDSSRQYANFYGMRGHEPFRGLLQSLGLFDTNGEPKKAWAVLRQNLQR